VGCSTSVKGMENLTPTTIQPVDCPANSKSLYCLCCHSHLFNMCYYTHI
jgi:hypothetical protein